MRTSATKGRQAAKKEQLVAVVPNFTHSRYEEEQEL